MARATREAAEHFRGLHAGPSPLLLVNAWNGISAAIIEGLGFPAVATTSEGVSLAEGVPDKTLTREAMLARVAVVTAAVRVPVTADLEAAYGTSVDDAVATARGAIDAGAVGLNFEDFHGDGSVPLVDVAVQCERNRAMRAAAEGLGMPLVINARTEAMRLGSGDSDARCTAAIERGRAYLAAGADCIFVPFVTDDRLIGRLAAAIPGPINVLARVPSPPVSRLAELGVRRLSLGNAPAAYALSAFRRVALEVLEQGTFTFDAERYTHEELTALVDGSSR